MRQKAALAKSEWEKKQRVFFHFYFWREDRIDTTLEIYTIYERKRVDWQVAAMGELRNGVSEIHHSVECFVRHICNDV